jgi:hypothetical protein
MLLMASKLTFSASVGVEGEFVDVIEGFWLASVDLAVEQLAIAKTKISIPAVENSRK